jgi:DNA-binding response OmpR family regulator
MVSDYLKPLGYEVTTVHTGIAGVEKATEAGANWDAVLLDVMLPGLDGFEVLKKIRATSQIPVLMLTGRSDETDRIVGLEIGADDYVPKTFSPRELLARLRAVLRRGTPSPAPPAGSPPPSSAESGSIVVGSLELNVDSRTVMIAGEPLFLTPVEFDLLARLVKSPGRVKTREALLDEIRERNYDVFDRSIDVHISSLRKKLHDHPKHPKFIRTVRTAGYMLLKPPTPPERRA